MRVIIHASSERKEYFFSTDHCQGVHAPASYPTGFTPISFYLPQRVVPRPSLPSGLVETVKDVITIFFSDGAEIPNPDASFQPIA